MQLAGVLRVPWQTIKPAAGQCRDSARTPHTCHPVPPHAVTDYPKSASELSPATPGGPRSEAHALRSGALIS